MPVKHRQRRAFALLGYELVEYFIESDYDADRPPTWGTAIVRDGKDALVIETHGEHVGDMRRGRYLVKTKRSGSQRTLLSSWKLKREALLDAALRLR